MALLSVIRRWAFREGMPIREISRRTGLRHEPKADVERYDALRGKALRHAS